MSAAQLNPAPGGGSASLASRASLSGSSGQGIPDGFASLLNALLGGDSEPVQARLSSLLAAGELNVKDLLQLTAQLQRLLQGGAPAVAGAPGDAKGKGPQTGVDSKPGAQEADPAEAESRRIPQEILALLAAIPLPARSPVGGGRKEGEGGKTESGPGLPVRSPGTAPAPLNPLPGKRDDAAPAVGPAAVDHAAEEGSGEQEEKGSVPPAQLPAAATSSTAKLTGTVPFRSLESGKSSASASGAAPKEQTSKLAAPGSDSRGLGSAAILATDGHEANPGKISADGPKPAATAEQTREGGVAGSRAQLQSSLDRKGLEVISRVGAGAEAGRGEKSDSSGARDSQPGRGAQQTSLPSTGDVPVQQLQQTANRSPQAPAARPSPSLPPVVGQIVDHMTLHLTRGENRMELHLKPDSLGHLFVEVASDDKGIQAKFIAQTPTARDAIAAHMDRLRGALEGQGLKVDQLFVQVGENPWRQSRQEPRFRQNSEPRERVVEEPGGASMETRGGIQGRQNIPFFRCSMVDLFA